MNEVGENLDQGQLIAMLRDVDVDGDNRINFEEFIQLLKKK